VFELTLACSEACANAVEHPVDPQRRRFEVEARRSDGAIDLIVRDTGAWREGDDSELRGRGLAIIDELMDEIEISSTPQGGQIRMRRRLAGSPQQQITEG
jgi:anti-sigma regulatory factor (Ser/Thr protein kinase)